MIIYYLIVGFILFFTAYIFDVIKTENHIDRFLAVIVIVLLWPLIVLAVVKYIAKIIL